jgi:hypothetical protein
MFKRWKIVYKKGKAKRGLIVKKLLLAAGVLCLAGCTENETPEAEENEAVQEEETEAPEERLTEKEIKQNQQLLDVLENVSYEFGVVTDNASFSDSRYGLAHADLIDVNQDGQDELYMLFRGSRHHESELEHRNQDGYIVEIWQANKDDEKAGLLHHDFINLDSLAPTDMSISFVTTDKGEVLLKNSYFQKDDRENFDESTYYAYRDGAFEQVFTAYHSAGEQEVYRLDDTTVDKETFEQRMKDYKGEEAPILKSEEGEKAFAFDTVDISGNIGRVFSDLTEGFNTTLVDGEEASEEAMAEIQKGMSELAYSGKVDQRDPETYEPVITSIIVTGKVPQDGGNLDYFMGYKEETVAKQMKALHNIDVDAGALELPTPQKPDTTKLLHYADGVFYVPPSDFHNQHMTREVTAATKVKDDTYFVTFRDASFDLMGYMDATQDDSFDPAKYEDVPMNEWPKETQGYISDGIPSYAVVKLGDGNMQIPYMGYRNLTETELESF